MAQYRGTRSPDGARVRIVVGSRSLLEVDPEPEEQGELLGLSG